MERPGCARARTLPPVIGAVLIRMLSELLVVRLFTHGVDFRNDLTSAIAYYGEGIGNSNGMFSGPLGGTRLLRGGAWGSFGLAELVLSSRGPAD